MALNVADNAIVEVRADIMSPLIKPDQEQILQLCHFPTPSFPVSKMPLPKLSSNAFTVTKTNPSKNPVVLLLDGWQKPQAEWFEWLNQMEQIHQDTWRQVGILNAIRATRSNIRMDEDIIFVLGRKWNKETQSFIFKWGEATVSLEDICLLGGFSVTGESVTVPEPHDTDMVSIEQRFSEARRELNCKPAKKATYTEWLRLFRNGNFEDIENEAFIMFWLSKYVFPEVRDTVGKNVQPIAIQLARGTRIALAPAVLASVYCDLGKLKENILNGDSRVIIFKSWSLMHIVQVWAWERFLGLRPNPNLLEDGDPRLARWDNLNRLEIMDDIEGVLERSD